MRDPRSEPWTMAPVSRDRSQDFSGRCAADDTLEQRLQRAGLDRGDRRIAHFARLFQEIRENYWFGGRKIRIRWLPRERPSSLVTTTSRVGFGARPASNVIAWVPAPLVMPPSPLRVHVYVAAGWSGTDAVSPRAPWKAVEGAVMLASGATGGGGVVTWSEKSSMKKLVCSESFSVPVIRRTIA